jgi:hypothetical protein
MNTRYLISYGSPGSGRKATLLASAGLGEPGNNLVNIHELPPPERAGARADFAVEWLRSAALAL